MSVRTSIGKQQTTNCFLCPTPIDDFMHTDKQLDSASQQPAGETTSRSPLPPTSALTPPTAALTDPNLPDQESHMLKPALCSILAWGSPAFSPTCFSLPSYASSCFYPSRSTSLSPSFDSPQSRF
ncbi:hypothetical protein MA16_Dca022679 [Dendrobium catenatum]|uniref:Uncharacterized protein n=1 Tax=Dendrobium catenatum TaxID=906689 RepID=A0A2I0W235_9ASPA|nr:hypothetical protein MA16_Dca022679 [Dendrobium catenatum]